jgi:Domain of unknown function (DUF4157)
MQDFRRPPRNIPVTQPGDAVERDADRLADQIEKNGAGVPGKQALPGAAIDLTGVRIHSGDDASESAQALGAVAYTVGDDVVLGKGADPNSATSRRLLAHELAHVVQQRVSPGPPTVYRQARDPKKQAGPPKDAKPSGPGAKSPGPDVRPGDPASRPIKEVLRLDQAIPIRGLAASQPNYVDRAAYRLTSPTISAEIFVMPKGSADDDKGIGVLKGDFFVEADPLSGASIEQNQVYRSRAVAEAVVADLNRLTPGVVNYTYYLRDGLIFPTILSDTTVPQLMTAVRAKFEQDRQDIKATGDLAEALLWWYVGARFPLRIGRGPVPEGAPIPPAAVFSAGKAAEELVSATSSIVNPGQRMLAAARQLSSLPRLSAGQKVEVMLAFFKRIGFAVSKAGVVDDGARLVMYSEDSRYAFAFLKDSAEILYGKFDMAKFEYVWQLLK